MPRLDLTEYAEQIARTSGRHAMLPVIEKELLHYEILNALEENGILSTLVFQGGTCLRLCYGSDRYSEDLDFAGGKDFRISHFQSIKDCIESALPKKYRLTAEVIEPGGTNSLVKKWRIKINTAPTRPDLPTQKISLEIAAVPAYTKKPRMLQLNYDGLLASYQDVLVYSESLEEILADKLESFACSKHIRYRDIWDLQWLTRQPNLNQNEVYELRKLKEVDYGETECFKAGLTRATEDLEEIIQGEEFRNQMKRFLPADLFEKTVDRPIFRELAIETIRELYRGLAE